MAITQVGTFASTSVGPGTSLTLAYTTVNLGDLCLITCSTGSSTVAISSLSGGGVTTWHKATDFTGGALASGVSLWYGTVTTVGAVTVTATYSTSVSVALDCFQFTAGLGSGTVWAIDGTQTEASEPAASTTMVYSSLTAAAAGELWYGYVVPANVGSAGSTAGFTYQVNNATWTNVIAYRVLAVSGAVTAPTAVQNTNGNYARVGAIFTASGGTSSFTRTASDTAAASDTATRAALTRTRSASDSAPASDIATVPVHAVRTAADSAPASDVAGKLLPRSAADTAPASDSAVRGVLTFTRGSADVAHATDSAARGVALSRGAADSALAVDSTGTVVVHATNASPNWPLMGFEVDFQNGPPSLPTGTRKSINAKYRRLFVRKWDTARGRQYELDQVSTGTCNLQLPDPNELLNPDNSSSPFNGGGNQITPYRSMWIWGMWPNQPGSGNIINTAVSSGYDSSFESSLGGWAPFTGSTIAASTAQAFAGAKSMQVTQSTAGRTSYGASNTFRTAPGLTYTFSAYVFPTGGCSVTLGVNLADGTTITSATATAQNVWTRLSLTWLTVDTLELVYVYSTQANPTFYVDATMLEFGSVLNPFTLSGPILYPIFTGYVERYPTAFDMSGFRALRPLQAVDALAILSRTEINQSYDAEVMADQPALYYRLDNRVTPASAAQLDTGAVGPKIAPGMGPGAVPYFTVSASGSVNWAGDAHPDGTPAVAFTGQNSANPPTNSAPNSFTEMPVSGGVITLNPQVGFSWECWVRWVSGTAQVGTLEVLAPGNAAGLNQTVPLIGALNFINALGIAYNPDGTRFQYFTRSPGALYADGAWHYLFMTVSGGTFQVGFDGGSISGPISTNSVGPIAFNTFYSEASAQYSIAQAQNSTGRMAVYNSVLSGARFLAHYQRGVGFYAEKSGARITRLLSKYWLGPTSVAAGVTPLAPDFTYSPIPNGGGNSTPRTVLDVAQEIQETERGLFYVSAAGAVVFEDRSSRYLGQASTVVFGENPAGASPVEYPYSDIKYDHDPTYTFSQANLSRPANSSFAPMVNATTKARYGQRILTQTVQVNQDFDLTQAGIYYLQRYGTPTSRVTTLVLNPAANPALWPIILGLELSQRVTVTRRSAFTRSSDYYIEKIAHSVDAEAGSWTTTLQLSPVFVPSAWVCGDTTFGVMGSTTVPIY